MQRHEIKARKVRFNLQQTELYWLPGDAFSSYMTNAIHLLLPEGELWFCRMYNKALPLIRDPELRADVEGFIRQEAVHSRVHTNAQQYLLQHDIQTEPFLEKVRFLAVQDKDPQVRAIGRFGWLKMTRTMERIGRSTDHVPAFSFLLKGTLRWLSPRFHPISEGNTQQALDYIARSPAARQALAETV